MAKNSKYSCVVFFPGIKPKKWAYVAKVKGFASFLNSQHPGWEYINVYDRETGEFLARYYTNSIFPDN